MAHGTWRDAWPRYRVAPNRVDPQRWNVVDARTRTPQWAPHIVAALVTFEEATALAGRLNTPAARRENARRTVDEA